MIDKDRKNELKIGVFLSIAGIILSCLIQILYTPFYIKELGTTDYGINSLVQSIISYISMLSFGVGNTLVRYILKYRNDNDEESEKNLNGIFFYFFIFIMILSFFLGIYIYFKIPNFFNRSFTEENLKKLQQIFLLMLITTIFSFPTIVFTANITSYQKFIYLKGINLLKIILIPIFGIILLFNGFGLVEIVIFNMVISFLSYFLDIYYSIKLKFKIKLLNLKFNIIKEVFFYSFYIFLHLIIDRIYWNTDKIIIGKFIGSEEVGIYSIATIFNMVYLNLSTSISSVFFPKVSKLVFENKTKEISNFFIKIGRSQYIILGLISSGFIIFGKEFIYLWLGKSFEKVYTISLWIMIPLTVPLIQSIGISIIQAQNKHKFRAIMYFIIALLNILWSILLVKKLGIEGCAIATGLSFILGHIIMMNLYYHFKIKINIILFWKNILKMTVPIVIASIIGIFLNKVINVYSIQNFIIKITFYSLIYFKFMYFMGMDLEEKNEVRKILKIKRNDL